jgi:uncharacterized damage-inducible protein DinB
MTDHLKRLVGHLAWADGETLAALRGAASPPERAVKLYAHVLTAEHVWLSRLKQQPSRLPVWPDMDLAACQALARENAADYAAYVESLTPGDAAREVDYRNSAGDAFRSAIGDVLLHVCLHGSYHRGQVAMLLRDSGAEPRATDYIAFTRGAPAARGG